MAIQFSKRLSILSASFAFATFLPAIAFAAPQGTPVAPTNSVQSSSVPTKPNSQQRIKLTKQQRQQLEALRRERNQEIEAALTQPQRTQFMRGLRSGQRIGTVLTSLNLNVDQKTKINGIIQASNGKMKAVISQQATTPSQPAHN